MEETLQFEIIKPNRPGNYANLILLKGELSNVYTDRNIKYTGLLGMYYQDLYF